MALSACIVAIVAVFFIGDRYFFDRVLYQKSVWHGYYDQPLTIERYRSLPGILQQRVKDTFELRQGKQVLSPYEYTVAVLGDSFVYGLGVRNSLRFTQVLEKMLQPYGVKVVTIALNGDSFFDNFQKYQLLEAQGGVDLYVFGMVNNDLIQNEQSLFASNQLIQQVAHNHCAGKPLFLANRPNWEIRFADLVNEYYYPSLQEEYANGCVMQQLLSKLAEPENNNIIFFQFEWSPDGVPSRSQYTNDTEYKSDMIAYWYTKQVEQVGFKVLKSQDPKYNFWYEPVSSFEQHPSARMHAFYAQLLAKEIITHHLLCRE
jgi:lysophospholipase L1-like esterase